jgi:hypothetical protein
MMAYPIEALQVWRLLSAHERPVAPAVPALSGDAMRTMVAGVVHMGLLGWCGAACCVLAMGWLLIASLTWASYARRHLSLQASSRVLFSSVATGVIIVFTAHYLLWVVFGVLVS